MMRMVAMIITIMITIDDGVDAYDGDADVGEIDDVHDEHDK